MVHRVHSSLRREGMVRRMVRRTVRTGRRWVRSRHHRTDRIASHIPDTDLWKNREEDSKRHREHRVQWGRVDRQRSVCN